jgi:TRAP-type C4-dicarboxylate transport system permease small subunit
MSAPSVSRPFNILERISVWLSGFCMIGMIVMILAEVILRGAFNSSTEYSDELVGYLLVGVSFFSLALCQGQGAFHRVEMVQVRLGPHGKAVSSLIFNLLSLAYVALTDWYFLQFVMSSYRRDARASTSLATPLWIPETVMIVGATMLLIMLVKAVVDDIRRLAS